MTNNRPEIEGRTGPSRGGGERAQALGNGMVQARAGSGGAPGWRKSDRPLRVAIIGWAWLALQGREGSGYNLNCSELARGLALSGHEVVYLQSGMTFGAALTPGIVGAPRIRHREDWGGVRCFDLVNSPNLSPAFWNFSNMEREVRDERSAALVVRFLREQRIDVVHVHSQEGYGLDLIAAIRGAGIPVVVTLHNYWFVCPQVDLLYKEREVCLDYEGGKRCEDCLPRQDAARLRRARAIGDTLEYTLGFYRADVVRKAVYGLKPSLKSLLKGRISAKFRPRHGTPEAIADPELSRGFDIGTDRADDPKTGLIDHGLKLEVAEEPQDYALAPEDANQRMLGGASRHLVVLNNYGRRRRAGVEALNAASLVTAPSDYLRRVHVAMGVPAERTRWVRLGQPHFDQIHRAAKRSPFYGERPWTPASRRPLRFCFMGTTRPNKGLEVLARAIPLLSREVRERCHISIHAAGLDWAFRKRLSLYPQVSVFGAYDLYQLISKAATGEYDVGILPHIWLENSPLVLLENLHAGRFVLCSRLGGPVDWVVEPGRSAEHPLGNGVLFRGGDEGALAGLVERCVRGDVVIPSAQEVHAASLPGLQSYPGHVAEVEGLYREVMVAQRGAAAAKPEPGAASQDPLAAGV